MNDQNQFFNKKVYQTRLILRLVPLIQIPLFTSVIITCIVLTVQVISAGASDDVVPLISVIAMTIFFVYAAIILSGAYYVRLELWEDGITFYGGDYRLYTPWENIRAISEYPSPVRRPTKRLELLEPASLDSSLQQGKAMKQAVIEKRWKITITSKSHLRTRSHSIPLGLFSKKDWERGEFLQDLSYYAPHINIQKLDEFYHETDKGG